MSIVIFGDSFSIPEGDASTNRVHSYAKGFAENGITIHVICFANNYTYEGEGQMDGYYFYNPFGQKIRSKYFLFRRWKKLLKYFKTFFLANDINKNDKITAFICYTETSLTLLFGLLLAKYCKSKIILERSEHALRNYQDSYFRKIHGKIKLFIELKSSDSIFCISNYLVNFYRKSGFKKKLFLVPSTVDPSRFVQNKEKPFSFPYIGYFGGLTFVRDNVDILIRAFAKINENHPEVHLVLGGFCSEKQKKQINDLITQLNIDDKVELLEYLKRQEILNYVIHSEILVMVRANSTETQASFPSKLTEFLVTSKPIISVNIGEISDYLTDGINIFLVKPEDINALSEKLTFVLDNYQFAKEVALKGKELTDSIFNYNFQARRIISFINSI